MRAGAEFLATAKTAPTTTAPNTPNTGVADTKSRRAAPGFPSGDKSQRRRYWDESHSPCTRPRPRGEALPEKYKRSGPVPGPKLLPLTSTRASSSRKSSCEIHPEPTAPTANRPHAAPNISQQQKPFEVHNWTAPAARLDATYWWPPTVRFNEKRRINFEFIRIKDQFPSDINFSRLPCANARSRVVQYSLAGVRRSSTKPK